MHGLIHSAAARYTRIAKFTDEEAQAEARAWAALHLALITELQLMHDRTRRAGGTHEHTANFAFFERLRARAKASA